MWSAAVKEESDGFDFLDLIFLTSLDHTKKEIRKFGRAINAIPGTGNGTGTTLVQPISFDLDTRASTPKNKIENKSFKQTSKSDKKW